MPIGTNNWDVENYRNKLENVKIIIKVSLFFLLKASFLFKMKGYHNRSFFDSLFCGYELDFSMNLPKAANFKVIRKTELMSVGLTLVSCHLVCTWLNIALMRDQCSAVGLHLTSSHFASFYHILVYFSFY